MLRYAERLGMTDNHTYKGVSLLSTEAERLWALYKNKYLMDGQAFIPEDTDTTVRLALSVAIVSTQVYMHAMEMLAPLHKEELPKYAAGYMPHDGAAWSDLIRRAKVVVAADILEGKTL
jgi:hypothetical protein